MAIMTFAHLKKKSLHKQPENTRTAGPIQDNSSPATISLITRRTTFRIPAVMLSALIPSSNYCRAGKSQCERFKPVLDGEDGYGLCWRPDNKNPGIEHWKKIPATATVSRCWFWMEENGKS